MSGIPIKSSLLTLLFVASLSGVAQASRSGIPLVLVKGENFSGVAQYRVQSVRVGNRAKHSSSQMNSLNIRWKSTTFIYARRK